jgi:hypothetical protein
MTLAHCQNGRFQVVLLLPIVVVVGLANNQFGRSQPMLAKAEQLIEMNVSVAGEFRLQIELTNKSSKQLEILTDYLPWRMPESMILVLVRANSMGTPIVRATYQVVADPGIGTTTLAPGKSLRGTIRLTERFSQLKEAVAICDVIVFWSYKIKLESGATGDRLGGWLLLSQSK